MTAFKEIINILNQCFLYYMIIYGTLLFIISTIGLISIYFQERKRRYKDKLEHLIYLPISILVPVNNDDKKAIQTIEHLADLTYCHYEIVVIKTGDKEVDIRKLIKKYHLKKTNKIIKKRLETSPVEAYYEGFIRNVPITIIIKQEKDKTDALNTGLNTIQYPYFITVEVGSIIKKDVLNHMIAPVLEDNNTIVVNGSIAPLASLNKKDNTIMYTSSSKKTALFHLLEYSKQFFRSRIFATAGNDQYILSTGFSLFKKEEVLASGGYDPSFKAESFKLDLKVRNYCLNQHQPFSIRFVSEGICYRDVSTTRKEMTHFYKTHYETLFYSIRFSQYKKSISNLFGLIAYLLYSIVFPMIELVGLISLFIAMILFLDWTNSILLSYFVYLVFNISFYLLCIFTSVYSKGYKFKLKELINIIGCAFIQVVGYRQINNLYCLSAFFKGKKDFQK